MGAVATSLALAGVLVAAVALPATWLKWEADAARTQAVGLAEAAASRAGSALADLMGRFDRASGSLTAQDLQGDPVALTARLLRAEPLVAPASGIVAIDGLGQQVASSTSAAPPVGPVWWYQSVPSATRQPGLLGCGLGPPDGNGWMLARRIDAGQDGIAAFVGSFVAAPALRALIAPAQGPIEYALSDADGCELLAGKAAQPEMGAQRELVRLYRAVLPRPWTMPAPVVATAKVGNLTWVGSISPDGILALRSEETRRNAVAVFSIAGLFAALGLLIAVLRRQAGKPDAAPGMAIEPTPPAPDAGEEVRRKLEEMAGERDRILAAIGHDVRTPMNSILGICALLLDGDLDESQRKWLQRIRASCQALLAMLNGMLEIAAARLDGAEVNREAVDVAGLVEEAGEVLRPQAEDKGLELRVVIDDSVLGTWSTDPTRLRQVLFNLCGNAVKYTVHGSVEIRASIERNGTRPLLRLRVTDTGPGIADDEREIIFEQFRRGRDEVSRGHEGLGLGLALCRDIASLLGGSLSLESAPGAGSAFTFAIPVERAEASVARGGPLAGRSALVVGLSEGVRRRVASHLEHLGFVVETAADGFLALGLAERIAFQHGTLDLMVLDAALFGLPAEALMARLKASHPHQHLCTVLVANGSLIGTAEDAADAVVPHPVEARDLDHVLATLFGDRSILQEIDPAAPAAPQARILVVEDNRINQALFVDQLTRAGFSTFSASNGREAIDAVRRGGFDAILMDIQMPELDGVEATRRIREAEAGQRRIPIVGLTAHTGSMLRRRCLRAGMDLLLHKPVDPATLPLRLREAMAGAQEFAETDPVMEAPRAQDAALDVDDESLLVLISEVGIDRAGKCVDAFLADTAVHIAEMERLTAAEKWDDLGQLAHGLAGISGTLGAMTFADGMLLVEDATRTGEASRVAAALADVHATWERIRRTLRARFADLSAERKGASRRAA
jgi:signal transduction histidine kinase/DNA-binding response OmpR family regulator